jgi:hypothetical protein
MMDNEILESARERLELARREKKRVEEKLRQLETPVDWEQLCREGVLQKTREKCVGGHRVWATFRILDRKRLPEHVALRLQIRETTGTTTKKGSAPRSVTKCTGKLNEAALKKKWLEIKKLLDERIRIQERILRAMQSG